MSLGLLHPKSQTLTPLGATLFRREKVALLKQHLESVREATRQLETGVVACEGKSVALAHGPISPPWSSEGASTVRCMG